MLEIIVPGKECFNQKTNEFFRTKDQTLQLEHSLISLSKWETQWNKPYLSRERKTTEEFLDYIRCMTLNKNVDPMVYYCLTEENFKAITDYINKPMTALKFYDSKKRGSNEVITSEVIYYWMITFGIPFECQKWHLNRLMALIRLCADKNAPKQKQSQQELSRQYREINEMRRAKYHTRG